ncbi:LCP family protein [Nocardiopsis ganjiahuensis]|uniref:LCP family protein n=1 Tax=Nocardiopsis ganjiahuensis TaxID=239984 RepID=UPI00037433F8|nr:LCP family protein [Nocardiopsis ganjiahuensis]
MPADENSADPGADHTPDETHEPPPQPEGTADDAAEQDADRDEGEPDEAETRVEGEPDEAETRAEGEPEEPDENRAESDPDETDETRAEGEPDETDEGETRAAAATEADAEAAGTAGEDVPETVVIDTDAPVETAAAAETEAAGPAEAGTGEPEAEEPGTKGGTDAAAPPEESSAGAAAAAAGQGNKRKRSRLGRVALWTSATLALVMLAGVAAAYGYYYSLRSDMTQHDIGSVLREEERPDKISDAVNILFIGSDGYEEDSPAYSTEFEGERSDSLMLAHISPDKRVSVISFPRDSLVQLPECDAYGQAEGTYGYFGMINAAMYHGGPPCVVRTIETLTDIRVDHFVHLSFASFRDVVDAIGGVDMCIPEPMEDRRSKLDLDAGEQTLDGDQALSFVRARYDIGDGGDMGRIDRQQMFLAALAGQVTSSDVLSSPTKLNGILQAVAQHSATDRELSLDRMLSIAVTMADVDLSDIEFHTVPWYQAPYDPNRVMWHEEEAAELFTAVREDRTLPELLAADDASTPQEPPTDEPTPADPTGPEEGPEESGANPSARPGEGRDATSNPCQDGLGFGTGEDDGW